MAAGGGGVSGDAAGRVAVVTGAARGIGAATVLALAIGLDWMSSSSPTNHCKDLEDLVVGGVAIRRASKSALDASRSALVAASRAGALIAEEGVGLPDGDESRWRECGPSGSRRTGAARRSGEAVAAGRVHEQQA